MHGGADESAWRQQQQLTNAFQGGLRGLGREHYAMTANRDHPTNHAHDPRAVLLQIMPQRPHAIAMSPLEPASILYAAAPVPGGWGLYPCGNNYHGNDDYDYDCYCNDYSN